MAEAGGPGVEARELGYARDPAAVAAVVGPYFAEVQADQEDFVVLVLNTRLRIVQLIPLFRGGMTSAPVATLGLAVNTRVKGQDGQWREDPCFVDVVVFGTQAEACGEYLEKGAPALVEGRLQYRTWEDDQGRRRSKHEVLAARVQFLPRPD